MKTVVLRFSQDAWYSNATRAEDGNMLTPVTLLLVPDGESAVVKRKVIEDNDFCLEVPNGSYEIFAIFGLSEDVVPDDLFDNIEIPLNKDGNGLTDFAVGSATVTNNYGKLSPPSVTITAKRQMAWMTAKINDLPTYITEIALYAKGLGETYNLADKWITTEEGKNAFTKFVFAQRPGKNFAIVDRICIPCTDKTGGTVFRVIAKTSENKMLTYEFISDFPLVAGNHLTANISINDLVLVNETVTTEDWNEGTINVTLTNPTIE